MPVMWQQIEQTLRRYFEAGQYDRGGTYSIDGVIQYVVATYKSFVIGNAEDPIGNRITSFDPASLQQTLKTSMQMAFNTLSDAGTDIMNSQQTTSGVVIDWTKSTIDFSIPHPGTYIPVSNVITNGGQPFKMFLSVGGNEDKDELAENITSALKQNAATVQGIYTGIAIGTGPGFSPVPAVPLPVPWVGIK